MKTLVTVNGSKLENRIKTILNNMQKTVYSNDPKKNLSLQEKQVKDTLHRIIDNSILVEV